MQKYKEINGNDYVKNSRTTINETMQSIQSMNSGTAFPTNNLFEGMKCYRTDLKKTYTLTDVENNTWVEDAHATLSDEATHAASATKLQTARSLNLGGAVTADAATFDGTANATINVKTLDATKLKGTASVSTTGNAATATKVVTTAATGASANIAEASMGGSDSARIRVSGAENAGELALETADDGSEPIVARQYMGIYENAVRTAKILDEGGNTSFPGTVVAPKFTGALNGNAATATKLSTARKINITGNATGSAGFDGTSDVNINVTVNSATKAVNDGNGANIASTYVKKAGDTTTGKITFASTDLNTLPEVKKTSDDNMSGFRFSSKTKFLGAVGKRLSNGEDLLNLRSDNNTTDVVLDSRNYNKYAPTKTGGGASGTWGINITGNAKTATTANTATNADTVDGYHENSFLRFRGFAAETGEDTLWDQIGIKGYDDKLPKGVSGTYNYGAVVSLPGYNTRLDIWYNHECSANKDGLWYRSGWCSDQKPWARLLDSNNYTNFVPTKTGAGASGTWDINISGNADKVDGIHAASLFYDKGAWDADNWATTGIYEVKVNRPTTVGYNYGQVISSSSGGSRFQLYVAHLYNYDGRLHYRTGWADDKQPWNTILDSENYNLFTPTKTGGGASGTWGINITGNAKTATTASSVAWSGVTGKPGTYPPSAHNHDSAYPSVTGARASGTWGINISGNADSATNADTVDGYHASDIINRISAANTGGIVAASLTENGYVKFANGLILQWGNASGDDEGGNSNSTFPIAFPSTCFVVLLTSKRAVSNRLLSQSKTGFTWTAKSGLISWAALGM